MYTFPDVMFHNSSSFKFKLIVRDNGFFTLEKWIHTSNLNHRHNIWYIFLKNHPIILLHLPPLDPTRSLYHYSFAYHIHFYVFSSSWNSMYRNIWTYKCTIPSQAQHDTKTYSSLIVIIQNYTQSNHQEYLKHFYNIELNNKILYLEVPTIVFH